MNCAFLLPHTLVQPFGRPMNTLRALSLCAALMAPACASANVIYEWRTASTSSSIYAVTGLIELTDAAAASGAVNYEFKDPCGGDPLCNYGDPTSPIVRLFFMVNDYPIDIDFHAGTGFLAGGASGMFGAAFTVMPGALGSMQLYVNDSRSHVWLDGALIVDANSDLDNLCGFGCSGATGGFFRDVPEPASLGLAGAGLLAVAAMRRRRRRREA